VRLLISRKGCPVRAASARPETLFPLRILAKNSETPLSQIILESTGDVDRQLNKRQQISTQGKGYETWKIFA